MIVASNHANALPISPDDRRICVLTNGVPMTPAQADAIHGWKDSEGAMAALQQWLWDVDLAGYDPYAPPPAFQGKALMVDANRSALDDAFDDALDGVVRELFVVAQLQAYISEQTAHGDLPNGWRNAVKRIVQERCYRVGSRRDGNFRIKIIKRGMAHTQDAADGSKRAGMHRAREEVLKSGDPANTMDVVAKLAARLVVE